MAKYIDADTVVGLRFFDDTCGREKTTIEVDTIENILDNFTEEGCPEPANVARVIHCRNCKYFRIHIKTTIYFSIVLSNTFLILGYL